MDPSRGNDSKLEAGLLPSSPLPNYHGPLHPGEAALPLNKLVEECERRVRRQDGCKAFAYYLIVLAVFVGIQLCHPLNAVASFNAQTREWLVGEMSGFPVEKVATLDDVWTWLNETYIDALWGHVEARGSGEKKGFVRGVDSVVGGIVLWQRERFVETQCSSFEQEFVKSCSALDMAAGFNTTRVDQVVSDYLPKVSVLRGGDRDKFFAEILPLYDLPTGTSALADADFVELPTVLDDVDELRESNWLHQGTDEVNAMLVLYSSGRKLLHAVQVRFAQGVHGEVAGEVDVWSGVINSFSDLMLEAGGGPWQLRITLEILFSFAVLVSFLNELAELFGNLHSTGFVSGMRSYLTNPWNWIDILLLFLAGTVIGLQVQLYLQENIIQEALFNTHVRSLDLLFAQIMSLANLSELLSLANVACLLLAFLRVIKLADFHPSLGKPARVLARARGDIVAFAMLFCIVYFGAVVSAWFLFAKVNTKFATLLASASSVGEMLTFGLGYNELLQGQNTDKVFWAWIPTTLLYFGFMSLVYLLLFNVLLGIIVVATQQANEEEKQLMDLSLLPTGPSPSHICCSVCCSKRSIKVKPGILPDDTDEVRYVPAEKLLNQLTEIRDKVVLGLEHPGNGRRAITRYVTSRCSSSSSTSLTRIPSFRSIEGSPGTEDFAVVFDYSDLCQTFTSDVATYLWVLFRRDHVNRHQENPPSVTVATSSKEGEGTAKSPVEILPEKSDLSREKVEELLANVERLQEYMRQGFSKVDHALRKRKAEDRTTNTSHPVSHEINKQLGMLAQSNRLTSPNRTKRTDHKLVDTNKERLTVSPTHHTVHTSKHSPVRIHTPRIKPAPVVTSENKPSTSSSTASPPRNADSGHPSPSQSSRTSPSHTTKTESPVVEHGLKAEIREDRGKPKERRRRKSSLEFKPVAIFKTNELDDAAKTIQKQYRKSIKKAESDVVPTSPQERKEVIRKILLSLFSPDGTCPLQKIKSHFQDRASGFEWQEVKEVRREMGIIQFKQLLRHEGGATVIRLWRKPN